MVMIGCFKNKIQRWILQFRAGHLKEMTWQMRRDLPGEEQEERTWMDAPMRRELCPLQELQSGPWSWNEVRAWEEGEDTVVGGREDQSALLCAATGGSGFWVERETARGQETPKGLQWTSTLSISQVCNSGSTWQDWCFHRWFILHSDA